MDLLPLLAEREAQQLELFNQWTPTRASVILCTRDRAARLPTALNALAAMQVREGVDWEVLVVDNGSVDSTKDTIETFIRADHPRFRYIYDPAPGKTYALNRGIKEAHGEILAFTDDDAIVEISWLEAIIEALERYSADGVGGKVLPGWEAERPPWLSDRLLNVLALLDYGEEAFRLNWRQAPHMLFGVNYAFRKSVFAQIGGFNTILGSRGEDQELFDRLAAVGACVFYDPAVVVRHVIPGERLTKVYFHDWHRASGRARAKLPLPQGRSVLGIPLYTLRKGFTALGSLATAALTRDKESLLEHALLLDFYAAYYLERIRAVLRKPSTE